MPGIGAATLADLRRQAALQVRQETSSEPLVFEVVEPAAIGDLPVPDAGDIFFDFEGDPLWTDDTVPADEPADWGLEYLFGVVEPDGTFRPFWAHDRAQEKQAFVDFLAYVEQRRAAHPGMHVYHYAPYERSALLRLAGRHGVGEDAVDQLLRDGVLVDLYATVRRGLRVGSSSYSLKKLEPLYMGSETRDGAVTTATDSITEYAEACDLRDAGNETAWRAKLDEIGEYNRYDCESTLRLRDWLLAHGPAPTGSTVAEPPSSASRRRRTRWSRTLLARADGARRPPRPAGGPDARGGGRLPLARGQAVLVGALRPVAVRPRRVAGPPRHAPGRRDARGGRGLERRPGRTTFSRVLRVAGHLEPGCDLRAGGKAYALYDPPPPTRRRRAPGHRGWTQGVEILDVTTERAPDSPSGTRDVLRIVERLPKNATPEPHLPMALAPTAPPPTTEHRRGASAPWRSASPRASRPARPAGGRPPAPACRRAPARCRSPGPTTSRAPPRRSSTPSSTSTAPTSPCRGRPARARRTPAAT